MLLPLVSGRVCAYTGRARNNRGRTQAMWGRPSPLVLKSGCRLAMAVLLSPGLPGTALPQVASAPPPEVIDPRGATREMQQREAGLRSAGMVVSESKDPRLVQAAV